MQTSRMRRNAAVRFATAGLFVLLLGPALRAAGPPNDTDIRPRKDYAEIAKVLRPFITREMAGKELPGLSIAIVDDQETVWAEGFGLADPKAKKPATADTVYRIGSVSKLFTDIAIMQLVERGELDLDAPITNYLPDFHPRNPFGVPITLRLLMSHHSGLLREPPVGNYFDPTETSLAATVQSLNQTELVYEPRTHTKYSNAAIAVAGYLLEVQEKTPFAEYLKRAVLQPLGMRQSAFVPEPGLQSNLAKARMWTYDGLTFDAPTFQLGMAPAGCMYSTVKDLGRFVSVLLARGQAEGGHVIKPETLDQMWTPQFPAGEGRGFGLGFALGKLDNHRFVGHGGAIYGFATSLTVLPDDKVGVVVTTTRDIANAVTERIATEGLRLILAKRAGNALSVPPPTDPIPPELGRSMAGRYGQGDEAVDLVYLDGTLRVVPVGSGYETQIRGLGDALITDGILDYGTNVVRLPDGIGIGDKKLKKQEPPKPPEIPGNWKGLVGEYGWDHDILYVFEREGKLTLLIEWVEYDSLTPVSDDVFKFSASGLYDGERAIFTRDSTGQATQVQVSGVVFKRRPIGGVSGGVFRIPPVKNLEALRSLAQKDHPPTETGEFDRADLVELATLDPTIKLDVRYASTNNFLGTPVYSEARAFLQKPAAEALLRVHKKLKQQGLGLLIHDAYRPWFVTKVFWEATPEDKRIFVADPRQGSRHNRGGAVDLSLYDLATGKPIEMPGVYDEMSERSYPTYPGGTSMQHWYRDLLRRAMEEEGFDVYTYEWWHFDYKDWKRYPILNVPFESLALEPK